MLMSSDIIKNSGIQFGTSGARGLVSQFTPEVCAAFTHAFIASIKDRFDFTSMAIAIDNRPSSSEMAKACIQAIQNCGLEAIYYGVIPTPALAFSAMQAKIPCIMVTGSHIPFDRNGLKFYRPDGEISKDDESLILSANISFSAINALPSLDVNTEAGEQYIERYTSLFTSEFLKGKRIGVYEHSSAGRDLYSKMFHSLGAEVIPLERSDEFVPIDTEAVSESDQAKALKWSENYDLDIIFSTDGDGDRPLVADENGHWLRGDILGLLCCKAMNIEAVAVPVSCNTIIAKDDDLKEAIRTKIGSPYVIAEFEELNRKYSSVAGFEANGGFLLGSDVVVNDHIVKGLPTRDAVLPVLMLLLASGEQGISELVSKLPNRVTHSDRIQDFPTDISLSILESIKSAPEEFLNIVGLNDKSIKIIDTTDGTRLTFEDNDVIHLRPSGNAPELRCYAESDSLDKASKLVITVLGSLKEKYV